MRRRLLAAASMIVLAGAPAFADEEINNERTSPVRTSTSGDIVITSSGRVRLTDNPGPAVVIDSDNTVETRAGSQINVTEQSNATGILLEGGRAGGLTHRGSLSLTAAEFRNTVPITEAIGDLTDEYGKTGIQIGGGAGDPPFTGNVSIEAGANITVVGNESYGIHGVGGLNGNLEINGTLSVGGRDSFGVLLEGPVNGDVSVARTGSIQTLGQGSSALVVNADVEGGVRIGGAINSNGFRVSDRTTAEIFRQLAAREAGEIEEDTRLSGSAVIIAGSLRDGLFIAAGSAGATSGGGSIVSTGSAPALRIQPGENSTGDMTLGEVVYEEQDQSEGAEIGDLVTRERGFGFVNDGTVRATGVFDGVDATAVLIAGRDANGTIHAIILGAQGFENTGTLTAIAYDAHAEGLTIGEGAQMATLANRRTGAITAVSSIGYSDDGFADTRFGTGTAVALRVGAGADVGDIDNEGFISAELSEGGASATAILLESESVTRIRNAGRIAATGSLLADNASPTLIAIDARQLSTGLHILQEQNSAEGAGAPTLQGDILFGDGDDLLEILAGTVNSNVRFGDGMDRLVIDGGSFTGSIDSGDGQLTVDVENGTLALGLSDRIDITSARFGDGGTLNLVLGANSASTDTLVASGAVNFEAGSEFIVSLSELIGAGGTFQVLSAGTLNIAEEDVILETVETPFLYNASLERDPNDSNALVLSLTRKTAAEAGLDANRAAVYDAAITLFEDVTSLGNAIASIRDADSFYRAYDQLLPEYAASAIQFALAAHDAAAGALSTRLRNARLSPDQLAGIWIQEFGYFADRAETTFGPGYRGQGVGLAVGLDRPWGPFYAVGVTLAGAASDIEQVGLPHEPMTALMGQFSAYAAADVGLLDVSFTASAGINRFETNRLIQIGNFGGNTTASWSGWHYSAAVQAGRDITLGDWILRPELALTWLSITEDGFNEVAQGNTPADLALYVDSRTTSALTGGATFTVGRMYRRAGSWWLPYARVGYRGDFSGSTATTTARFGENGTPFTLRASEMPGAGILAGLGLSAGSEYTTFTLAYDADMRDEYIAHVLRLVLRMNF